MIGVLVLAGTLAIAAVLGLAWRSRQGRVRPGRARRTANAPELPEDVRRVLDPAASVNLVQLSTTFCAPCRHARVLLADLAARTEGVHHAELDLTSRPDLVKALSVFRTPTTLALDANGTELLRVGGVPKRDALLEALRPHLAA
jgi:thiol-disulfide isomerase/thioredoxin